MPQKQRKERGPSKDKDRTQHRKASRSHRRTSSSPERMAKPSLSSVARRKKAPISEVETTRSSSVDFSPSASRSSLPYPSFSKAHSKECVTGKVKPDPFTPNPTDIATNDDGDKGKSTSGTGVNKTDHARQSIPVGIPPSPPLTSVSVGRAEDVPTEQAKKNTAELRDTATESLRGVGGRSLRGQGSKSSVSVAGPGHEQPRANVRVETRTPSTINRGTSAVHVKTKPIVAEEIPPRHPESADRGESPSRGPEVGSSTGSEATSATEVITVGARPGSSYVIRPPGSATSARSNERSNERLAGHRRLGQRNGSSFRVGTPLDASPRPEISPQPPPPPPPPAVPAQIPRVDYLLQNGGLPYNVPRTLFAATREYALPGSQDFLRPNGVQLPTHMLTAAIQRVFAPYHDLLNQYETVMSKNGSIAVATGYRSVARRLLDRLEAVFARDISSEYCECPICHSQDDADEEERLGWGDVLEWVSGRKEVPSWPIFDSGTLGTLGGDIDHQKSSRKIKQTPSAIGTDASKNAPIDIDVPREFREHYRKQTKKTKEAVDRWLASQISNPTSPPQEVDDETLTFAILTHLKPAERDLFKEILDSPSSSSNVDSKLQRPRSELLSKTGDALQKLYRLSTPPRDPESAAFLVRHPSLHKVLATLAAVTASEWDVLTSGRFDGFLWSGAEDPCTAPSPLPSRGTTPWNGGRTSVPHPYSRGSTPFSPPESSRTNTPFHFFAAAASRGTTPAPTAAPPVSVDEETEIAVLAEVEREIYVGMEALEDAFEALHQKAESVRRALRERGAGLSMAGQTRRYGLNGDTRAFEIGRGTPGLGYSFDIIDDSEDDTPYQWGGGIRDVDSFSDVWPDDSASNISSNRVRRPKRRTERRTPAPVEEEEEEDDVEDDVIAVG
ncbi:MAG: hypothetical protein M1816_007337 [Peltula sp. TS41687]|nr:MAG: hypothetical protein M1816_007337 [Peltula sp. TS41687]